MAIFVPTPLHAIGVTAGHIGRRAWRLKGQFKAPPGPELESAPIYAQPRDCENLERLKTLIEGVAGSPPAESSELSDIPSLLRRVAFDRDIDAMATAASEAGEPLTPVMSDVDHFKAVNGILSVMKFCGKSPASSGRALDRKVLPTGTEEKSSRFYFRITSRRRLSRWRRE